MVQPAFPDVLNRCERVVAVQTQDRCFPKMGCCSTSSQGQVAFEKGSCSLSLLRWVFVFAVYSLRILHKNQNSIFLRKFRSLKKVSHSHNPIASLSQSVITYCHQKNPLRVRTKPHIRLCKAWSSQRFKSLPSILSEIVVCS